MLELSPFLGRSPRELSGGQRQRVAMGRALVRGPAAFLLDEPLSNLDAKLRVQMRLQIKELQRSVGTTALYVTHDQVEAMTLADRLIVMNAGRAEQIDTPMRLYERPATVFVAGFIGSPAMNLIPATAPRARVVLPGGAGVRDPLRPPRRRPHSASAPSTWPRPRRRPRRDRRRRPRRRDPRRHAYAHGHLPADRDESSSASPAAPRRGPATASPSAPTPASTTCSTPPPASAWGVYRQVDARVGFAPKCGHRPRAMRPCEDGSVPKGTPDKMRWVRKSR